MSSTGAGGGGITILAILGYGATLFQYSLLQAAFGSDAFRDDLALLTSFILDAILEHFGRNRPKSELRLAIIGVLLFLLTGQLIFFVTSSNLSKLTSSHASSTFVSHASRSALVPSLQHSVLGTVIVTEEVVESLKVVTVCFEQYLMELSKLYVIVSGHACLRLSSAVKVPCSQQSASVRVQVVVQPFYVEVVIFKHVSVDSFQEQEIISGHAPSKDVSGTEEAASQHSLASSALATALVVESDRVVVVVFSQYSVAWSHEYV